MKIAGQYVGLGLGDSSNEIRTIKAFMRRKFSYAKALADTGLYDAATTTAVATMQARYNASGKLATGKYTPGIINAETKYVMGYLQRPTSDTRPLLLTICGTGVPWWVGPDADIARAVESKYFWQPVGYPAQAFPMGTSIDAAKSEFAVQANRAEPGFQHRQRIEKYGAVIVSYSQGAVVASELWENDIKPDSGALNWMKPHMLKACAFGNPNREIGKVWPDNGGSPMASLTSGGVSDTKMVDTPTWWRNYAHTGDLYAAAEPGKSQEDKNAIWQVVRNVDLFTGPNSLLAQVLELSTNPVPDTIAMFKAILDAGMFFAKQTGPHVNYGIQPAIDYLLT